MTDCSASLRDTLSASHFGYGAALTPGARAIGPYAASAGPSRGRLYQETACPTRSAYQRDRDRILHASAFRRLTHKTQVFLFHEGDHYRTRLTHTLEVAQIARTVARQLCLDEDLAEALALAHDLGHPPFGHAGERALNAANKSHGGFDHNAQSLRLVMQLERKYSAFDGLNLTFETLEGLVKHNGPIIDTGSSPVARVASRLVGWNGFQLAAWPSAEAQVAALADDIAYATHDIDDGLRAGLINFDQLSQAPIAGEFTQSIPAGLDPGRRHYEVTRRMITALISDLVVESRSRLTKLSPVCPDDIRAASGPVIAFSDATAHDLISLKAFLFARVYRHSRVVRVMDAAEGIVRDLYARYLTDTAVLPVAWHNGLAGLSPHRHARVVVDFVAGMTDRFAIAEHRRLFDVTPDLR